MTREEAIKELKEDKALYMPEEWIESLDRDTPDGRLITAIDMAIEALEQESCDKCEVGNPCLYCKHEFEPQESEVEK